MSDLNNYNNAAVLAAHFAGLFVVNVIYDHATKTAHPVIGAKL